MKELLKYLTKGFLKKSFLRGSLVLDIEVGVDPTQPNALIYWKYTSSIRMIFKFKSSSLVKS